MFLLYLLFACVPVQFVVRETQMRGKCFYFIVCFRHFDIIIALLFVLCVSNVGKRCLDVKQYTVHTFDYSSTLQATSCTCFPFYSTDGARRENQ